MLLYVCPCAGSGSALAVLLPLHAWPADDRLLPMNHPPASDDERRFWLALHRLPGVGPKRFRQLLDHFGSIQAAWNAPPTQLGQARD